MHYLDIAKKEIRSFINSLLDQSQNLTNGRSAFVIAELEKLAIAERARNLELRGLLEEAWSTLCDVCEYHGDPEYQLDVEAMRELMKRIYAAKGTEPMILATSKIKDDAKGSELLRIWQSEDEFLSIAQMGELINYLSRNRSS